METILSFLKDGVGVGFEDVGGDLLATVGRETVHDECIGLGQVDDALVDLIGLEGFEAVGGFFLLAHADPDIGVEHIGTFGGGLKVLLDLDIARLELLQKRLGRLEIGGSSEDELESQAFGSPHPGAGDIAVDVAGEDHFAAFPAAEVLLHGEEVGENLARVFVVVEGVDGWDATVFREAHDVGVVVGADDTPVEHPPKNAGSVFDGLATAELKVAIREEHDGAPEFAHTRFEADASAGGGLGEDESPALVIEREILAHIHPALALQFRAQVDEVRELF